MLNLMTEKTGLRGDRLRKARERIHFSQEELAAAIGAQQQAILRWEKEEVDPKSATLKQLALALEVSTDYLLGLSDVPGGTPEVEELTPQLRKLIWLVKRGATLEAIEMLAGLAKQSNQT